MELPPQNPDHNQAEMGTGCAELLLRSSFTLLIQDHWMQVNKVATSEHQNNATGNVCCNQTGYHSV